MIVTDILLDGLFAAVAAIGFGAISDPPMRAFPRIALLAAIGHALRFTLIHCAALDIARIAFRGLCNRHGQPVARPRRPLPDDLPLHSGPAADGAGHLRLQDGLLAHHVPPVARSCRRGDALHATVLSQCHRIAECHCAACRRCHAADIHLQTPGFLDDPTHTKK